MTDLHPDLLFLIDSVEILDEGRYSCLGEPRELGEWGVGGLDDGSKLIAALADDLYERLYIRPREVRCRGRTARPSVRDFVASLSRANTGKGTWESGWAIRGAARGGRIPVVRDGLTLWAKPTGVRACNGVLEAGETCRVLVPNERRNALPGYYLAIGDADDHGAEHPSPGPSGPGLRFYWHLAMEAAVEFVAEATSLLNGAAIPFRLKLLSAPEAYFRADAGVIYADRRDFDHLREPISRLHERLKGGLREEVPLFTRPLARGLGFAEDAPGAPSFGEHRCRLAAEALHRSFLRRDPDRSARIATLGSVFRDHGVDPLRPHRSLGSTLEDYPTASLEAPNPDASSSQMDAPPRRGATAARVGILSHRDAAMRIAQQLCDSAIWDPHRGLCNWFGRDPVEYQQGGSIVPAGSAIGPDLYGGSAGVALFLAQAHAASGTPEFRRAAVAGIRRSILRLGTSPARGTLPLSLHCGPLGVALAAFQIGTMTGEAALVAEARSLADAAIGATLGMRPNDVINGKAGAILALLAMGHELAPAIRLGEELCRGAVWTERVCTWPEGGGGPDAGAALTGMSHGSSGIALALFELHGATGRSDFLATARGAFAHEDSLFDPARGNWPDLREGQTSAKGQNVAFSRTWCHGAPGIALARMRASRLDEERASEHRSIARLAVATTLEAMEEKLAIPGEDASLCHGLSGLIEVVLNAGLILGDPDNLERARNASSVLIDRHAGSGSYPSGLASRGPNPSLMLGIAGTGHAFLRLHHPSEVPSILMPTPIGVTGRES